ncbi:MAG: hypothetical protein JW784_01660 [Candidatus Cloacimonetes bacterium]|nr:hypothetical protein [Candidatus Cloacimonadota bacterium]
MTLNSRLRDHPNDLLWLLLACLYLIPVFIASNSYFNLSVLLLALFNINLWGKMSWRSLALFALIMILPLLSLFVTVLIYTRGAQDTPVIMNICGFNIYRLAWQNAIFLTVRAGCLAFLSFSFLLAVHYDRLVLSLLQNFHLSPAVGYALLITFNALSYMREEYSRIRLAYLMRFRKRIFPLNLIFPILVSATRYAHFAGLSLECRGLNREKTYLESYRWQKKDAVILLINLCQIFSLIALFVINEWFSIRWQ